MFIGIHKRMRCLLISTHTAFLFSVELLTFQFLCFILHIDLEMEGSDEDEDGKNTELDEGKMEFSLEMGAGESLLGGNVSSHFNLSSNTSVDIANFIHTQGVDLDKFDVKVVPDGNGAFVLQQTPKVVEKPPEDIEFVRDGKGRMVIRKKNSPPPASQAEVFQAKPNFRVKSKTSNRKKSPAKKKSPRKSMKSKRAKAREEREEDSRVDSDYLYDADSDLEGEAGVNPKKKRNKGGTGRTALTTEEWSRRFRDVYKLHCDLAKKEYTLKTMPRPAHLNQQQWDWVKKNARKCQLDDEGKLRYRKIDSQTKAECEFSTFFSEIYLIEH